MFRRVDRDPEDPTLLERFDNGPVSVVCRAMVLGQYRMEVWYQQHPKALYPDILSPVC